MQKDVFKGMMKQGLICAFFLMPFFGNAQAQAATDPAINLNRLPSSWDEGLPLGNGQQGALIWQKDKLVRMALDRADLWDERPMKNFDRPEFSFEWVRQQYLGNNYKRVQELFDDPYNKDVTPTKLPGAALEITPLPAWGSINSATVDVFKALAAVKWSSGVRLQSFVSMLQPLGFFRIQGSKAVPMVKLVPPPYGDGQGTGTGSDLSRLGYKQGKVDSVFNGYMYTQNGYGGFAYRVTVFFNRLKDGTVEGVWTIATGKTGNEFNRVDTLAMRAALRNGFDINLTAHVGWWGKFWQRSSITVPDADIQRHYHLAKYFLASTSRPGNPPISLQAVWTADNGKLPPWKGDFHHDLNTQMSYWPTYTANHLEEAAVFTDYLDARKETYKTYTSKYFGKDGLNVPGVTTLAGSPMGGWIQYAFSPTVSAWLSHHFYWQWKYGMDGDFLKLKAYPWVKETAVFLEQLSKLNDKGQRQLPLSSSPEIHDNSAKAWFTQTTNYDLSLMKFTWNAAAKMARASGNEADARRWDALAASLPPLAQAPGLELMFAPNAPYNVSHRHFSHLMAIYPLGQIRWEDNDSSRQTIKRSVQVLDSIGYSGWTGYSFTWLAALKARAHDGAGAEKALRIFTEAFCGANGFHLNGDATGKYSGSKSRPFTLEGNFGFAAAVQEMLIQSYSDTVNIMPAVPESWQNVSFKGLRTEGGFVFDVTRENGRVRQMVITAEADGFLHLRLPYTAYRLVPVNGKPMRRSTVNGVLRVYLTKGSIVEINPTR